MNQELQDRVTERLRQIKGETAPIPEPEVKMTVTPEQLVKIDRIVNPDNAKQAHAFNGLLILAALLYLFVSISLISDWMGFVGTPEYHDWKNRVSRDR